MTAMKRSTPALAAVLALSAACSAPENTPDARVDRDASTLMDAAPDVAPDASGPIDTGVQTDTGVAPQCPMGQTRCGETCADLQGDATHCGACGNACPAGQSCTAGRCGCPMGQELCAGACVELRTSTMNCGACGNACPMGQMCVAGACRVDCPLPRTICGAGAAMECVDAANDARQLRRLRHRVHDAPNAEPGCVARGSCGVARCNAPSATATAWRPTAARSTPSPAPAHCGGCGVACPARAHASNACAMGACTFTCDAGFADCDGDAANGCEVDTRGDHAATAAHAAPPAPRPTGSPGARRAHAPSRPATRASATATGWRPTAARSTPASSAAHCGRCGGACPAPANGAAVCTAGVCTLGACSEGFADCNAMDADGCETNVNTSASHCGRCGMVCAGGQMCSSGVCMAGSTMVTFPSAGSTVGVSPSGTLGSIGGMRFYQAGDFVTETFMRTLDPRDADWPAALRVPRRVAAAYAPRSEVKVEDCFTVLPSSPSSATAPCVGGAVVWCHVSLRCPRVSVVGAEREAAGEDDVGDVALALVGGLGAEDPRVAAQEAVLGFVAGRRGRARGGRGCPRGGVPHAVIEHQPAALGLDQRRREADLVRVPPGALARLEHELVGAPVAQVGRVRDPDVRAGVGHGRWIRAKCRRCAAATAPRPCRRAA
jgi:hypothetical protein